ADSKIVDAHIDFPSACVVDIYPLMMGGELPSADVLTAVQSIFSDDIRPMTDKVTAKAPTQINYDINIKYYCTSENEEAAIILVESEGAAID
ncbi:baseplate J/gp47 family protein, partial [Pseudomonas aeruginosa]